MNAREELQRRLTKPQRHRLLQGFPAVPAMVPASSEGTLVRSFTGALRDVAFESAAATLSRGGPPTLVANPNATPEVRARDEAAHRRALESWERLRPQLEAKVAVGNRSEPPWLTVDRARDLIVGVIPHTQCVPRREACGFCTFPHDPANKPSRLEMLSAVERDVLAVTAAPEVKGRRVHALYLGGGTANLSSTEEVERLLTTLRTHLVLDDAELTLEGTPALFESWFSSHLKSLAKQRVGHRRISMGVQTFDPALLTLMGREKFGDAALVKKLAKKCRELAITTSADLLFNLPGQSLEQMERDVDTAIAAGLEQICLYHLVLYDGLGTPWAKEEALLRSVPDNGRAAQHWLTLRDRLLRAGYEQSTLTNFERKDLGSKRFRYELASFSPDRTDALGFGPMSLSTFIDWPANRGLKLLRRKHLGRAAWSGDDLMFQYDEASLRLLFVTRSLATTRVDARTYAQRFGTTLQHDFAESLAALIAEQLVAVDETALSLTPLGMFFADSVVSTLAAGAPRSGAGLHTAELLKELPRASEYLSMG